ncbi:MAG: putative toxin-antitoxin system toxin component, PIN family [Rhodocyclales bacterium]|nr:putative toxin-antitoxin system toxin component, PIN family [Rhodocyclales bacterium]
MKLVLDTNVVLELLYWRDPRSEPLGRALAAGRARCFTDAACLGELERVLGYPQFALDAAAQQALHAAYRALATGVDTLLPDAALAALPRCRDTDDQKFMELALRCGADLLVTRDKELLRLARSRRRPAPFAILVPERAIALLDTPPTTAPEQAR